MIQLYKATDTEYTSGINITRYCRKAHVTEILNGSFLLELELMYNDMVWNTIAKEMQIKVPTHRGPLTFRILDITKDLTTLKIRARHLLWDLSNNLIEDIYCKTMDGDTAIKKIISSGNYPNKWTASSDIIVQKNCRIVQEYMLDALMGDLDNSFRNRWGGELTANDYSFSINMRRGSREPREIKFRKDIAGFEYFEDTSELATRIMPIGFDGLILPEKYIDSPLIDKYAQIYIKKVKLESIKIKQNDEDEGYTSKEEAYKAMREAVQYMYDVQDVDKPKQNFRADMVLLRQSEQYAKYNIQALEDIQLGDAIQVNLGEYNITSNKRCISITYDCLSERYLEVEVGDFKGYEELSDDFQTNEINIDDKLDEISSGMFFIVNENQLTVGTQAELCVATTTFASVSSTHLNCFITITGSVSTLANADMRIVLNNDDLAMRPRQTIQPGYFTWTVSCPLLFIRPGIPYEFRLYISTDAPITIPIQCLSVVIYGQAINGLTSEYPSINCIDQLTLEEYHKIIYRHPFINDSVKERGLIALQEPLPYIYKEVLSTSEYLGFTRQCHYAVVDTPELILTVLNIQAYWQDNLISGYYSYDDTILKITSEGITVKDYIVTSDIYTYTYRYDDAGEINMRIGEAKLPRSEDFILLERID